MPADDGRSRWHRTAIAIGCAFAFTAAALLLHGGLLQRATAALAGNDVRAATASPATSSPTPTAAATNAAASPKTRAGSFPTDAAIARAVAYLRRRDCDAALAVVASDGAVAGFRMDRTFTSASIVKAMLLVQYLRTHTTVTAAERATLEAMICASDNDAAFAVSAEVGAAGLRSLARSTGMSRFRVGDSVLLSRVSARDQARFFFSMDEYIPARYRRFARRLLSHICARQTWGVAEVARPTWRVYFKSGWLGSEADPYTIVNQVARLECGRRTWAVAILTDDNPHSPYAFETLRGVTRRLLNGTT